MVERTDEGRSRGQEQRPAAEGKRPKRTDLGKVGRRAAAVVYGILALWISGAALWSVVPQIFWPGAGTQIAADDCAGTLGELRGALLDAAGACVAETQPIAAFRGSLASWDERYQSLRGACGAVPGYADLAALRYALAAEVERHAADVHPLAERARTALAD